MNRKRVASQTLVGKRITVTLAKNKSLQGTQGVVENETMHTITVGKKVMQKNAITITVEGHSFAGSELIGTLQRIKRA